MEDDVPSPCVTVCTLDPDRGQCLGCFRTADEIACWVSYTNEEKRAVIGQLAARMDAAFDGAN